MTTDETIKKQANYMVDNNSTVRATAKVFRFSKSSIHLNVTKRLKKIDPELHKKVRKILDKKVAERHARGGAATREKYRRLREKT